MSSRTLATAALALVLSFALVSGCGVAPPTDDPGIVGRVTTIEYAEGGASMLVEGGPQAPGAVSDKAMVRVTAQTAVFDADGRPVGIEALSVGVEVRVWFDGAVAESYPVQGTARAVAVTGD